MGTRGCQTQHLWQRRAFRRPSPGPWLDACNTQRRLDEGVLSMLDLLFIVATVVGFALAFAYVRACDRV
jgi:hypothetical protein